VRVIIPWNIERTKGNLQLDIGFGDRIHNGPIEVRFPTLIDQIQPVIMVYSKETALAEKLQIIVSLNYETSRIVFSTEFITNKEKQTQWEAFLVRSGLDNKLSFMELMKKLKTFFVPLLKSSEDLVWNPKQWHWDKH